MRKLDRLGWAEGIAFSAYGRRIGIRTDNPAALAEIATCLPPGWVPLPSPVVDHLYSLKIGGRDARTNARHYTLLYAGLLRLARTMNLNEALEALAGDIEQYLAVHADNRVFVHAGVVGWQGRAIVLPGRTFAGKSTLVAALLRAGATYYSDEFAVLDEEGQVHPFPRLLSIRKETGEVDGKRRPEQFGGAVGSAPLPVGLIAFLEYQKGEAEKLQRFSAARAAMQLIPYAYCATAAPQRTVAAIARAVQGCESWRGKRGEADAAAQRLLRMIDEIQD